MKFKVNYTIYSNYTWSHTNKEEIIEADTIEEDCFSIESKSNIDSGEYIVNKIEIMEE